MKHFLFAYLVFSDEALVALPGLIDLFLSKKSVYIELLAGVGSTSRVN